MAWKFAGDRPVYQQIMEHVRGAVLTGELPPGGRVPSVRELAAQAGVNPNTMQRALYELEQEGLLQTQGTLGRVVTEDEEILSRLRRAAVEQVVRRCDAALKELGLTLADAARLLQTWDEEEKEEA